MQPELADLKITEHELESLTGLDISETFIGGFFGGVYRPISLKHLNRVFLFCLTEAMGFFLFFILSLPVGLLVIRDATGSINQLSMMSQFLQVNLGTALALFLGWNLYMKVASRRFNPLVHVLDEVDKYNEMLQAIALFDQLEAVGNSPTNLVDRHDILEALRLTRDSLVAGLMTEKILRESRGLLSRRADLLAHMESNLAILRTQAINYQATEYGHLLNEALQIGISVHREVQAFSTKP